MRYQVAVLAFCLLAVLYLPSCAPKPRPARYQIVASGKDFVRYDPVSGRAWLLGVNPNDLSSQWIEILDANPLPW